MDNAFIAPVATSRRRAIRRPFLVRGVLELLPCAAGDFIFAAGRALDDIAVEVFLSSSAFPPSKHQIIEPTEDAEMHKAFDEAPKGSDHNAYRGNRVAVKTIELREQVHKRPEPGNANKCRYRA
jgi:hypothetical protein